MGNSRKGCDGDKATALVRAAAVGGIGLFWIFWMDFTWKMSNVRGMAKGEPGVDAGAIAFKEAPDVDGWTKTVIERNQCQIPVLQQILEEGCRLNGLIRFYMNY